ncbi:MAG: bifunctional phosphopantothenoylcysteine decarboxylase/phosphopantothenate--cysteine ligase CoaBC [Flavobacteriales bacterium]
MLLQDKKILLAVTGSIAAYKSAYLVRLLVQAGAQVKVIMSPGALEFVTPLTFSSLSGNPVSSDFTENKDQGTWTNHVHLALWADLLVVAPASANTLSKMATGQSDNFLLTTYMSARCPVMIAPAMDHDMFLHPGTQDNLRKLQSFGHHILSPKEGALASGLIGKGRMIEPEEIVQSVVDHFHPHLPLKGKKALVTAGPTYEAIDPVRFIGNHSSGKMGFELALALADAGAQVQLISGPSSLNVQHPSIELTRVTSAAEMLKACQDRFEAMDIAVMSAAVADYRPAHVASEKIKKNDAQITLELEKTVDIAATLGKLKKENQKLIGFALETENLKENAVSKLNKKNLDFIVLNDAKAEGAGFKSDTNQITVIWPNNKEIQFGLKAKSKVAKDIVDEIVKLF